MGSWNEKNPLSLAAQRFPALQEDKKLESQLEKPRNFDNEAPSPFLTLQKSIRKQAKTAQILRFERFLWSCYPDLNRRPHPYQGCALPTELQQRMATRKGLEPSTSGVTGRRSNQLNYRAIFLSKDSGRCNLSWQGQKDSNPRHSVLETDALPAELYP